MSAFIIACKSQLSIIFDFFKGDSTALKQLDVQFEGLIRSYYALVIVSIAALGVQYVGVGQLTDTDVAQTQSDLSSDILQQFFAVLLDSGITFAVISFSAKIFNAPRAIVPALVAMNWLSILLNIALAAVIILGTAIGQPVLIGFVTFTLVIYWFYLLYKIISDSFQTELQDHLAIWVILFVLQLFIWMQFS